MSRTDSALAGRERDAMLVVVGGILAVAGTALPWLSFSGLGESRSLNGLGMLDVSPFFNGAVTALLGLVAAALYLTAGERENVKTLTVVVGVIVTLVAATVAFAPGVALGGGLTGQLAGALASPGVGVMISLAGGVLVLLGGMVGYYG